MTKEKSSLIYSVDSLQCELIAHWREPSTKKVPAGWFIGLDNMGPFESVDDIIAGSDAVAVIAKKTGNKLKTVIIDGKERGDFNNCFQFDTASKKLLIKATRFAPEKKYGIDQSHEFLLHKNGIHGPLTQMHEVSGFPKGAFTAFVVGKPDTYDKKLFIDDVAYDSIHGLEVQTDLTGAKYLICDARDDEKSKKRIVTAKNVMFECDRWRVDHGVLVSINTVSGKKETTVYLGGVVLATYIDAGVQVWPVGKRVLQSVHTTDTAGKDKSVLLLDRVEVFGPCEAITSLTVDKNVITFTSYETSYYGTRQISLHKFLVNET